MSLSEHDKTQLDAATLSAGDLVGMLSKLIAADNEMLGVHAQDLREPAMEIEKKLVLLRAVSAGSPPPP